MASTEGQTNFKLTPSQQIAYDKIRDFIKKPIGNSFNDRVLVLTGEAGTGKTTLLKHALKELIEDDLNYDQYDEDDFFSDITNVVPNVMGVTISHKAKLRLQDSIPNACTYAGYFGLKPEYMFDGTIKFVKGKSIPGKTYPHQMPFSIVVHDEVSMYDMNMINYLEEYTNSNSKIILVGDPNQLPPIIEDVRNVSDIDSPVFIYFTNKVQLKERVRQTVGNPILDLSSEISKEIFGDKNIERILNLIKEDKHKDGVGYRTIKRTELIKDFISHYVEDNETRVICYRNKTIDTVNRNIRKKLFPDANEIFVKGDALYMNLTYKNSHDRSFYNSDEFTIPNLKKENYQGIEVYRAQVKHQEEEYILLVTEKSLPLYKEILNSKRNAAKNADFKSKGKKWEDFYNFRDTFADVSYGYAFTAYKAQGSDFTNVYVDLNDILSTPISDKRKLQTLYTAITRATHQVIFF